MALHTYCLIQKRKLKLPKLISRMHEKVKNKSRIKKSI